MGSSFGSSLGKGGGSDFRAGVSSYENEEAVSQLADACRAGDRELVAKLLSQPGADVNETDVNGGFPLLYAALVGDEQVLS